MNYPAADELFTGNFQFENNIVLLRPLLFEDIKQYRNIVFDETIWTYFATAINNEQDLDGFVNDAIQHRADKSRVTFTSIHKDSGQITGSSSFGNFSFRDKRLEIGWTWVAPKFQQTGVNRSNKFLLLQYAFEGLGMERVELKTDVLNLKARNALTGIGATEEGVLRSHTLMQFGRRRDTIYYSILKNEWPGIKESIFKDYK
ncbi:MAG: GNAT family N-acetyltransferase [Ferruginibacter sp.]|nr:GNAT family N-acetyltransferase [Ferruginibacter sp.]